MRLVQLFFLASILMVSCKSPQKTEIVNEDQDIETITDEELFTGKVVNDKKSALPYVAIKLVIDDSNCMSVYTDEDGMYDFLINPSKIKESSYFEFVYKGYAKKLVPYNEVIQEETVVLSTKGDVITRTDYRIYYEAVKTCNK